jgi:succinate dehydrogenase / fumarate reductase cytochrome b subunit
MITSQSATARTGRYPGWLWLNSSIGKKTVVAVTGIALVAFVIGHLLGNLTFFLGPDSINAYGAKLKSLGPLLWVIRISLLAILVAHIYYTMKLWQENKAARPQKYIASNPVGTTVFARTMRLSGLIVFAFVIFHLAHFTVRVVDTTYATMYTTLGGQEVHDVYKMMVAGFNNGPVVFIYIIGLFLLTFHLSHGLSSLCQTFGITNRRIRQNYEIAGRVLAWSLYVGFISIPISIFFFALGKGAL